MILKEVQERHSGETKTHLRDYGFGKNALEKASSDH